MLARLQKFITLALLAVALAWAAVWLGQGRPGLAVVGALLIAFGYAAVLALEFALVARVHRDDPTPRASLAQLVGAWWGEVTHSPLIFCWRQPFCPDAVPDEPGRPGQRGVVFVHGLVCNRGFWTPWLRLMRQRGVPFATVNLEPVFGSIDAYPAQIEAAVRRLEASTGMAPVLVCHSMGGLAARVWLQCHAADARVHRVITIGTPHHGTWLGRYARTSNTRQMHQGSEWLRRLADSEPPERYRRFTCFYGHCDNIVFPASTGCLPGAVNRHLEGVAHVQMAFQPQVFNEVLASLADVPSDDTTGLMAGAAAR
ncbi:alpha/beta fold hydrolase [Aquabacterium sp. A7-Y]|uniref:esterase/lipase family protein n=1 Tax=Aquabacterium sp. A7-Y TaxID=1349605 RepID=UPI00223CBE43|nr:alpha/beta fold hydrolase [Aquabacterium sp. A7-Y]MCW7542065.1 alpha/beta fold hydrolase [Aquabacterium sp. A7-Y]